MTRRSAIMLKLPFWLYRFFAKPVGDGWWQWGKVYRRRRDCDWYGS